MRLFATALVIWSSASSSMSIGNVGSWSTRSITFSRDGRSLRSHSGGGAAMAMTPNQVAVNHAYDDDGSSLAIAGPNVGGGTSRKSGSTKADREGTYHIDGYTLELRYDSGKVERRFFAMREDRKAILFGDEELGAK